MPRKKGLSKTEMMHLLLEDCDSDSDMSEISDDSSGDVFDDVESENEDLENPRNDSCEDDLDPAGDVQLPSADQAYSWTRTVNNDVMVFPDFIGRTGPNHSLPPDCCISEYVKLFFTTEVMEMILKNTNSYAEFRQEKQPDQEWNPIKTTEEIWAFFSIMLIMSIVKMPKLTDYWSTDPILGNEMVKRIMSRGRFQNILKYFHVSDKKAEVPKGSKNFSLLQKIQPLISILKQQFAAHLYPGKELSVDEAIIKFKGRLGIIQYMPMKPAKRGIKVWMLCTPDCGYTLNFEVYCGKKDETPRSGNGLGYDVVMHLIKPLKEKWHELYFDRFFTSVVLVRDLYLKGLYSCGTVLGNRKNLPSEMKNLKLRNQGESESFQSEQYPNILCTTWMDKKQISMLSSNSHHEISQTLRRKGSETNTLPCPSVFCNYNKYMGGVDLADQNRKYYSVSRKSRKWWIYVFWFLLDTSINNAYIIYARSTPGKHLKLYDFKRELIRRLSGDFCTRKRASTMALDNITHVHKRTKVDGRKKTCAKCRKEGKKTDSGRPVESSWKCTTCDVCLCKDCF